MFWLLNLRLVLKSIAFVSTLILVRILAPEDFGLVALATSFYALVELMTAFGFEAAIIQTKDATKQHYSTVWTFRMIVSCLMCGITFFSSEAIANFYQEPKLILLTKILSVLFIIKALNNPGMMKINKEMQFKKLFQLQSTVKVTSFIFTISFAFYLQNYFALIIGLYVSALTSVVMSYYISSFRPTICLKHIGEIFKFSKWMIVNAWLNYLNTRTTEIVLGYMGASRDVGLFNVSNEIAAMPSTEFGAAINKSSYSGYSMVKQDLIKLRTLFTDVLGQTALITIPACIGIYMLSYEISHVILGKGWESTQTIIEYIALASIFSALTTNHMYIYMALGKPRLTTMLSAIRAIIFFAFLIPLSQSQGINGAAKAVLYTSIIYYPIPLLITMRTLTLDIRSYISNIMYVAVSVVVMVLTIFAISEVYTTFEFNNIVLLMFIKIFSGAISFTASLYLLWIIREKPSTSTEGKVFMFIARKLRKG